MRKIQNSNFLEKTGVAFVLSNLFYISVLNLKKIKLTDYEKKISLGFSQNFDFEVKNWLCDQNHKKLVFFKKTNHAVVFIR